MMESVRRLYQVGYYIYDHEATMAMNINIKFGEDINQTQILLLKVRFIKLQARIQKDIFSCYCVKLCQLLYDVVHIIIYI